MLRKRTLETVSNQQENRRISERPLRRALAAGLLVAATLAGAQAAEAGAGEESR